MTEANPQETAQVDSGQPEKFVSGFVSILGRPNVGKSTLLNALLGTKVAIVTDKPQTTRAAIQGILNLPGAQIVFMDTPGIHEPDTLMNKRMMKEVQAALEGRDLLLFVVDATAPVGVRDEEAVALIRDVSPPKLLLLNKIDQIRNKAQLLPLIDRYRQMADFEEYIPISALTGDGLDVVKQEILKRLPEGPAYFPEGQITDQPLPFFVSEIIREKIMLATRQEVPHAVMVQIDEWEDSPGLLRVAASIYVEREGQKAIIIGAKGAMLKRIGTEARMELEALLGKKVYLELFVKVRKDWREKPVFVNEIGWKHYR